MNNNYAVILDNVSFAYDDSHKVLANISLKIPQGKIVAIMGGSGSGKTTLLRLISGQIKADSGSVNVLGSDVTNISARNLLKLRQQMGMLFQFGALFTDMSVYDNVAFSLKEHTKLPDELINKIVAMKLNAVGLFGTQDMMPQELSGGMARRVALARAIALDPQLMLYDEPFTGLDPISLNVIAMLISRLSKALQQTAILVTHDIASTMSMVDYVFFMADGKIMAHGTPEQIKHTENQALQQFISGNPEGPFNYQYATPLNYQEYLAT